MKNTQYFLCFPFFETVRGLLHPPWRRPCLRTELCPLRSWIICILETESCNLVNTFWCKFNKENENKIPILLAQLTQIVRYVRISLGGTDDYTGHPLSNTT